MSFFQRKQTPTSLKNRYIGLSEDNERYCLVHFLTGEPTTLWQDKPCSVLDFCQQAVGDLAPFTIVRPIPHHYIWRKYIFLPKLRTPSLIYRQVIQAIKQELPVPLTEIYFDYSLAEQPDGESVRVIIYALRKSFAEPLIVTPNTVLDCELHCAQRALHFLQPESEAEAYQLRDLHFQFKTNSLEIGTAPPKEESLHSNADPLYLLALGAALWTEQEKPE